MPNNLKRAFTLMKRPSVRSQGFTLIELLVVIALIGILTTLVMANLNAGRSRSRDAQRKSDLRSVATALRLYYNDLGSYPTSNSSGQIMGCTAAGTSACSWGEAWEVDPTTYMSTLPQDPLSNQSYKYEASSDAESFTLSACLENTSDDKGIETPDFAWCPSGIMYEIQP